MMNTFQPSTSYQQVYGSPLLDEIHNHFPAILYSPGQFQNVQDLLRYIQIQARTRFNPFVIGEQQFRAQQPPAPIPAPTHTPAHTPAPTTTVQNNPIVEETTYYYQFPMQSPTQTPRQIYNLQGRGRELTMSDLLQTFLSATTGEDVPVRPSDQDLAAATTLLSFSTETVNQEGCAICTEDFGQGDSLRRLNHCNHHFHRNCIDTWFIISPRCPICRHDVRERRQQN